MAHLQWSTDLGRTWRERLQAARNVRQPFCQYIEKVMDLELPEVFVLALDEIDRLGEQIDAMHAAGLGPDWTDKTVRELKAEVQRLTAELAEVKPRTAPVQGYAAGIPWAMHLRAYDAYCKKYGQQRALVEGGCRGGFHVNELDLFIPGWREELSEMAKLQAEIERLTAIIERIPKTADGVPVCIGMMVYWIEPRNPPKFPAEVVGEAVVSMCKDYADLVYHLNSDTDNRSCIEFSACYSTREAAEAANRTPQ